MFPGEQCMQTYSVGDTTQGSVTLGQWVWGKNWILESDNLYYLLAKGVTMTNILEALYSFI